LLFLDVLSIFEIKFVYMTHNLDWHHRYQQQARWTSNLRSYFFSRMDPNSINRIIEVGCGTGAVLETVKSGEENAHTGKGTEALSQLFGLDINPDYLKLAHSRLPITFFTLGDAYKLPFGVSSFDIVFCHFLMLWIKDPLLAMLEMRRIARPGGWIAAFAEPDYGGRVDFPASLVELGRLQTESLRRQGAEPLSGRRLKDLFQEAELVEIECGVLGAQWVTSPSASEIEIEWQVVESDLKNMLTPQELDVYRQLERDAWQQGRRILFVPTFYAFGRVPI
jgi:ubiquinone/menaquinone biosynthesis C-methylase UbiE